MAKVEDMGEFTKLEQSPSHYLIVICDEVVLRFSMSTVARQLSIRDVIMNRV